MLTEIPIQNPDLNYQTIETDIGDRSYRLTLQQCASDGSTRAGWFMDIRTQDLEPVALNRRLKLGDVLQDLREQPLVPDVRLLLVDTSGTGEEPGPGEIGRRVRLMIDTEV